MLGELPKSVYQKQAHNGDIPFTAVSSPEKSPHNEIEAEEKLLFLFQESETSLRSADSLFPEIEEFINQYGWQTLLSLTLSNPSFRNQLENPDMAVSLLVESLEAIGIPETIPTKDLETALETISDSLSWIKLSSFIQKRKETEKGELTDENTMTRILAHRNEVEFWDKKKAREVASKILKTNPLARRRFIKDYCSVNTRYSPEEIRAWLKKDPDRLLEELPSAFSFNAVMNTPPFEATEYGKRLTFEDREASVDALLPEDRVRSFFQDAIQHSPPDAYFTEYHRVTDNLQCGYFLDPHMDIIDLFPLMEKRCRDEWGEKASSLAYIKESTAIELAHGMLALYNPSGRLTAILDIHELPFTHPSFETGSLLDFYTAQDSLLPNPNEDHTDADFKTLVTFFDLLPPEFQKAIKDYFTAYGVDIEEIAKKLKQNFGSDSTESTPRKMRLLSPKNLGKALRDFIEAELEKRTQMLSPPIEIDLRTFNETVNSEYALPEKNISSTEKTLQSLSFDAVRTLEQIIGIPLADISLREVFSLVDYLKNSQGKTGVEHLDLFLQQAETGEKKLHRLTAFLSLEQGGKEMGEKILAIADRLDSQTADAIFEKYASVVSLARETEDRLRDLLGETDNRKTQTIAQNLLLRAQKTMASFADHPEWDARAVQAKLDSFSAELFLFADTFREMRHADADFSLETIRDTRVLLLGGRELSDELFAQMQALYEQNYLSAPELFRELLQEKLFARKDDVNTRFYIVTHKNRVIGFNTFTDIFDESDPPRIIERYFASFNIDPALAQSKIGDALMQASLDKEFERGPVSADCIPDAPITQTYLNKKGFVGTGIQMIKGIPLLKIRKDSKLSKSLAHPKDTLSQVLTPEDLTQTNLFEKDYLLTQYIPSSKGSFECVFKKI